MRLETLDLWLVPFTGNGLALALKDFDAAAAGIGAQSSPLPRADRKKRDKIYRAKLELIDVEPGSWLLCTAWQMVRRTDGTLCGEVGFKGRPIEGEVEIGYTTREQWRSRGYMTQAVAALCEFAFAQTAYRVESVMAATLPSNVPSQRVLEKCGFHCVGQKKGLLHWRKRKPKEL